jgi:seryl-tRNA synthetase
MTSETAADPAGVYRDRLIEAGLLIPTGVDGLYGRSAVFESVVEGLDQAVTRMAAGDGAELMRFPPLLARDTFLESGYLNGFPHLAGTVHCFCGNERDHQTMLEAIEQKGDWAAQQQLSDVVLTPAACYPIYPVIASRGPLPPEGKLVDVFSYCFRHEPSIDPCRMQMFRMRENVRIGTGDQVLAFRDMWLERGHAFAARLAVPAVADLANDPFFGRAGKLMADGQRGQQLKFEMLIPVTSEEKPTACMSFNYHMTHFSEIWPLRNPDGAMAHTACVAFGIERLTLALFRHHGFDTGTWPASTRAELWPEA